jgi:hypothetical protein
VHADDFIWTGEDAEGKYANCFRIGFNAFEMLMDFAQCNEPSRRAVQHTRIVVSPTHGKEFLALLSQSIDDYEMLHGKDQSE